MSGARLKRELGIGGAVVVGLGSILGTGVFVSIGFGAAIAGTSVLIAIALAGLVATCNGLSSAQLAASHPVSGGTYEYGYQYLSPSLGFTAGWMFLSAKSASAATAALGFAGYLLNVFQADAHWARVAVALGAVVFLTVLILTGLRRTNRVNTVIVAITILSLGVFVIVGLRDAAGHHEYFADILPTSGDGVRDLLNATALMFVAYTGYGRIATMGEEVRDPRRIIPRAIIITLVVSMGIYIAVGGVATGALGVDAFVAATEERAAPLEVLVRQFDPGRVGSTAAVVIAIGAITAMLGVLLNLILGLSRVALAMGRRGDLPRSFAQLDRREQTPVAAVILVAVIIAGLTLVGDLKTTWTFSAFTVLIYYSITNLAAIVLPAESRLYPRWISAAGLLACLSLAFFVEVRIWVIGLILIAVGLLWHIVARRIAQAAQRDQ